MLLEGKVGPVVLTDGASPTLRMTKDGALVAQDVHSRYHEAVYRGGVFTVSTAVAGVAPGTVLSTTPPFIVYNPATSGKNLVILQTAVGYVSGTLGGGTIVYAGGVSVQPGATILTPRSALIGGASATVSVCSQGGTVTLPTIIRPAYTVGAWTAATAAINPVLKDQLDGEFIIIPGSAFVMQGVMAAGSTPLMLFSATWEEVAV